MQKKPDPILLETVRMRIRLRMEELGISQAQLADGADIKRSALNEVLNKNRLPGCDFFIKIAERLEVSIDYLVGRGQEAIIEVLLKETSTKRLLAAFSALDNDKREHFLTIMERVAKFEGEDDIKDFDRCDL
jgi:transcriptional regulator with XRE-family HTH domain